MSVEDYFAIWFYSAVGAAIVAHFKGRTKLGWFGVGMFLGPFALVAVTLSANLNKRLAENARAFADLLAWRSVAIKQAADGDAKECPMCAERVKAAAIVCRYCSYDFPQ